MLAFSRRTTPDQTAPFGVILGAHGRLPAPDRFLILGGPWLPARARRGSEGEVRFRVNVLQRRLLRITQAPVGKGGTGLQPTLYPRDPLAL
jgi:hypothetical protein